MLLPVDNLPLKIVKKTIINGKFESNLKLNLRF